MNELEALVILAGTPHLGSIKIKHLLQRFGSALDALKATPGEIADLPGFGYKIAADWGNWHRTGAWKHNLELVNRCHAEIIPFTNERYPKRLLEIPDHPVLLYVKGDLKAGDQRCLAIVGTRNASVYGTELAETFARDLAAYGFTIVSGLARGIDTAAHRGALARGRTFAVIGSGLADIYPRENGPLAAEIAAKGALISEFPMATPPDRQNFPQRNRIVSGMTMGTLLVEAPARSGAMLTMENAHCQGRRLFALPGRVDHENFRGNHHLIKTGRAKLVENVHDILECFENLFSLAGNPGNVQKPAVALAEGEADFLAQLPAQEISIEEMIELTKLPVMKLNVLLMSLVLKKAVKEFPGKVYKKMC